MDLLGSIMSKMERPPVTTTQAQRDAKKKQVEAAKKQKEKEKEMIRKFRLEVSVQACFLLALRCWPCPQNGIIGVHFPLDVLMGAK